MVAIGPGITGELQRWTKLSLEVEDKSLHRDGAWLAVNKTRFLRKFAVDMSGAPPTAREVPVKDRPSTGCGVELTRLDYSLTGASVSRYTFGFEAFGPKMRLLDVLQTVCVAINSQSPLPELRAEWSASYPAWLIAPLEPDRDTQLSSSFTRLLDRHHEPDCSVLPVDVTADLDVH